MKIVSILSCGDTKWSIDRRNYHEDGGQHKIADVQKEIADGKIGIAEGQKEIADGQKNIART